MSGQNVSSPPHSPEPPCPDCGGHPADHSIACSQHSEPNGETKDTSYRRAIDKREATVLHCDVGAAVRIGRSVDLESYHEYVHSVLECIRHAVRQHRHRGDSSFDRVTGDSILFCFGIPLAGEEDASDAVAAALAATAAVRALPIPEGVTSALGIGVATGPVVFGVPDGDDAYAPREVTGVTANLAARLQSLTHGGSIVLCDTTRAIVARRFLCESLGEFELKGLGRRRAWRVQDRPPPSPMTAAPMVGRNAELAEMIARWREACDGEPGVVLVRGEPGIGKSRLLDEFKMRIAGDDILLMDVRCSHAHRDTSFHAIADHLERTFRLPPAGPDGARESRLEEVFVNRFGLAADDLPQVAGFLTPAGFAKGTATAAEAKARRDDAMRSMVALLHNRVRVHRAAVAFIEDVQWCDASSFEFLCRSIREAGRLNLLFVYSARPEFDPNRLDGIPVARVELAALTDAQCAILVGKIDKQNRIPPSVVELAVTKCDGIPLYVTELTRSLLDRASSDTSEDRREADLMDALQDVPKSLRGLLNARLDRSIATRSVAQAAAVIGREFSLELLRAVAPLPNEVIDEGLRELVDADLIAETSSNQGVVYAFRHALIQDVAYDSLMKRPRCELHAHIASALTRTDTAWLPVPPTVIAQHYTAAGRPREAIHHWMRASRIAAERSDNEEAARHLYRAIELAAMLDDPREAAEQELELRVHLVPSLLAAYGYGSDHVAQNTACAKVLFPFAQRTEPKTVILRTECNWAIVRAEYPRAAATAREIGRLAAESGVSGLTLDALLSYGLVALYQGHLDTAREKLEQCCSLYDPAVHEEYSLRQGIDIASAAPAYLARALWLLGDTKTACEVATDAIDRAARSAIPLAETQALGMKMLLHLVAGEFVEVRATADRTAELARRRGQLYWVRLVSVVKAWLDSLPSAPPEALAAVDRGIHDYLATGSRLGLSWLLLLRADVEYRTGHATRATGTLGEALTFALESDERYYLSEIHRVQAKLLWLAFDEKDRARELFDRALETAAEQRAAAWRDKTTHTVSNLLLASAGELLNPTADSLLLP